MGRRAGESPLPPPHPIRNIYIGTASLTSASVRLNSTSQSNYSQIEDLAFIREADNMEFDDSDLFILSNLEMSELMSQNANDGMSARFIEGLQG